MRIQRYIYLDMAWNIYLDMAWKIVLQMAGNMFWGVSMDIMLEINVFEFNSNHHFPLLDDSTKLPC